MRYALLLLLALPLNAGRGDLLERATRDFASDDFAVREGASRAVKRHIRRELAPLLEAMHADDPEVRRRAREAVASFLPVDETDGRAEAGIWAGGQVIGLRGGNVIVVQGGNRIVFNNGQQRDEAGMKLQRFGIAGYPVHDALTRAQLGLAVGRGFAVTKVVEGSPAAQIGLRVHDVLVRVGGRPVLAPRSVLAALGLQARWLEADVRVIRRGKPQDLRRLDPRQGRPR